MPVEVGHLQQQVAAGDPATTAHRCRQPDPVERVEPARDHEPLDHRSRHPRAVPEVGQRAVRASGHDALDLRRADALDVGEREPDAVRRRVGHARHGVRPARSLAEDLRRRLVPGRDALDAVGALGGVDVEAEDRDAEVAGVVEDEPLGVHARVVGEHAGEERRRVVRLEPRRVVGRQRERRGVGLAEAERGERPQHLPHLLDGDQVVAERAGGGVEPRAHLLLPVGRAEAAPHLVGLGQRAAGHHRDDAQHLLVEDHHAVGLLERGAQVVVQVDRCVPPLPCAQERRDHVGLHRPGPEQRDVGDEVVEGLGRELADELALPGRLDLEAAQGVRGAHQRVGRLVVERHRVEVDDLAVDALDLGEGVGHRRLHADAEHVELEQPELLDVVLVELAHGEAHPAGLDRRAVEQRGVGEQHAARVQRDVARQTVERLDEGEEPVELAARGEPAEPGGAQLGQLLERLPRVARADVREGLGERVDLARRHAERGADVAHRVPHAVGVAHRHARAALAAEALEHAPVDLGAARGLDVDVDVGQRPAQRREEPLHEQAVRERVDAGDAEQVVDQAARTRAARRDAHLHPPDEVDHLADGEEVAGEARGSRWWRARRRAGRARRGRCGGCGRGRPSARSRSARAGAGRPRAPRRRAPRDRGRGRGCCARPHPPAAGGRARARAPRRSRGRRQGRAGRRRRAPGCRRGCRSTSRPSPAPPEAIPDRCTTSCATRRMCAPSARWPSPLARSRCRESSGTSRRIASSTSTTGAWSRSAWRTALASTAGRSCSRAKPSIRAAAVEEYGSPRVGAPDRSLAASARSRARWLTTSIARRRPNTARHGASAAAARSGRRRASARPTSESGPSSSTRPSACSATTSKVVTGAPRCTSGTRARGARSTGSGACGRSPRWAAETSRHSEAHPVRPRASRTTRGWRGSTSLPPRAGVRRAEADAEGMPPVRSARVGPLPSRPAEVRCTRDPRPSPQTPPPAAPRPAPTGGAATTGCTARSRPRIGAIPASRQARTKRTVP